MLKTKEMRESGIHGNFWRRGGGDFFKDLRGDEREGKEATVGEAGGAAGDPGGHRRAQPTRARRATRR